MSDLGDTPQPGLILVRDAKDGSWLRFHVPVEVVEAHRVDDVVPALRRLEDANAAGLWAAGFIAYEAAPAFDPAFVTRADRGPESGDRPDWRPPSHSPLAHSLRHPFTPSPSHPFTPSSTRPLPLLHFGLYRDPERLDGLPGGVFAPAPRLQWEASVSEEEYRAAIARIKECIARGETYQVNYTVRLRAPFGGSTRALFAALAGAQQGGFAAYVDTGAHALCSASPELFFRLSGDEITCRPMKGTAPRGVTCREDEEQAAWLASSEKNRAENVMIVDMIRNDLGRVARPGSVAVPALFEVERYETLFQMTSTVTARTDAGLSEIMGALFPCASITGAPKVRTMEIIAGLESAPRGIYTGCIGFAAPGRRAQFNVAIRTVHVDRARGLAEYGTGGGIVWDSTDTQEYEECRTKAEILFHDRPAFRLLETLLWEPGRGYFLPERHLARLAESARYFGFPMEPDAVARRLDDAAQGFPAGRQRVRLLLSEEGALSVEAVPLVGGAAHPWRVALAREPIDSRDRFLCHKTTHRGVYERARAGHPEADDVILWNERGEITESTIANVVVQLGGERITPPVSCGLLAGTFRAHLLEAGEIREGVITQEDLRKAEALFLINSVRGWVPAEVVG